MAPCQAEMADRILSEVREQLPDLTFEILEIGAVQLAPEPEPFYRLLDDFPGSRVHAFELDPASCEALSAQARPGLVIHPAAIGRCREQRTVHLTNNSMCTSLYRPNEGLLAEFNQLEVASLRSCSQVETRSLDELAEEGLFERVDFIKIDIQGAELDAFLGASRTLRSTVAIVTEVEFSPIYEGQPLFGDVDRELRSRGFMFHKFFGLAGRCLRPVVLNNNPRLGSWHLWSDAMYLRQLEEWPQLDPAALARLAILGWLYGSPDVCFRCLQLCDQKLSTRLVETMIEKA
ncbi:MAG: FkbM family methyltransferase [Cyanobacteriota bacterium]|nr:FkbM family methyltransferase [Cyanobacteriota bacterium]